MSGTNTTKTVSIMSGLALEVAVNRFLKPAFEAGSDYRIQIDWRPTAAIMKSIDEGQRADMVIAINESMRGRWPIPGPGPAASISPA